MVEEANSAEALATVDADWFKKLGERQQKQVLFSELYARDFHHGADGHGSMMLIAEMAFMLNQTEHERGKLKDDMTPK